MRVCDRLREISPALSAGIVSANLMALADEIRILEQAGVPLLHFDVMDGHFVPPLTVGAPFVKGIRSSLWKDVHLMISNPLDKVAEFAAAGADMITVHLESTIHIHRVLQKIGELENANAAGRGIARGIALNPGTPLDALEPLLDQADIVFLLAVNPGYSGQKFIPSAKDRWTRLQAMLKNSRRKILAGIDGGVTRDNIQEIAAMGPDVIVSGSAIFDGKAAADNARFMMNAVREMAAS